MSRITSNGEHSGELHEHYLSLRLFSVGLIRQAIRQEIVLCVECSALHEITVVTVSMCL